MTKLAWDQTGERTYETGVDHGVLYIPDDEGVYADGYAWNGLTTVTESPAGAEATAQYADNIKYLNLLSAETFGGTIEAFTYPDEFGQCDGTAEPEPGLTLGQQGRRSFGLAYRTLLGNDIVGTEFAYKLHLIYGATAAPSEKAYATVNDSPSAIAFSWAVSTIPTPVEGYKPTSTMTLNSSKVDATALAALELILYGTTGVDPRLPLPDEVIALFAGTITTVTPTAPTFVSGTHTITIPTVAGVEYRNDADQSVYTPGAHVIAVDTVVKAHPTAGHVFPPVVDDDWFFDFV